MASLSSNETIGTPARLGVARLGASRLGAAPRASQITSDGVYAWARRDTEDDLREGDPPASVENSWTTGRS